MTEDGTKEIHLQRKDNHSKHYDTVYIFYTPGEGYHIEAHGVKIWADRVEIGNAWNPILGYMNSDAIEIYKDDSRIAEIEISNHIPEDSDDDDYNDLTESQKKHLADMGIHANADYQPPKR